MEQTARALDRLADALGRLQQRLQQHDQEAGGALTKLDRDNAELRAAISTMRRDMQSLEHANRKALSAVDKAEKAVDQLIGELTTRG